MAENTKIQWCHATWSPWRGCTKISPGCSACYAEALSRRNPAVLGEWGPNGARVVNKDWRKPLSWDRAAAKAGERRRIFPSLCDWLEDRPELVGPRARFLKLIGETPNLDWLLLTKRPENFTRLVRQALDTGGVKVSPTRRGVAHWNAVDWLHGRAPLNVWHGVSVENQEYADSRVYHLLNTAASVRWVSYEPALGPVDWACCQHEGETEFNALNGDHGVYRPLQGRSDARIDWIVVGGESNQGGKQARPFDLAWARSTVEQCRAAGVPVFVKQLGARPVAGPDMSEPNEIKRGLVQRHNQAWIDRHITDSHGGDWDEFPDDLRVRKFPAARVGVS